MLGQDCKPLMERLISSIHLPQTSSLGCAKEIILYFNLLESFLTNVCRSKPRQVPTDSSIYTRKERGVWLEEFCLLPYIRHYNLWGMRIARIHLIPVAVNLRYEN